MASFITKLFSRFTSPKRSQKRNRRSHDRKLRVECMEARRLLAGDLGSIAGNVFTDLLDNGINDGLDTALVGTTVRLYTDGGNGTFDSSNGTLGGDDFLAVGRTITTDGSGNYRFDNLPAGKYFVEQAPATGKLQRASVKVSEVDVVDITTFDDSLPVGTNDTLPPGAEIRSNGVTSLKIDTYNVSATTPDPLTATTGATVSDQIATAVGEALGGERDVVVNNNVGSLSDIDVQISGGLFTISPGVGTSGSVIVSYDGIDASASTLDHTTLGATDLTLNGGAAFHFIAGSEAGNTITIDVFSGAGNSSRVNTLALPITVGGAATQDLIVRFSDFSTTAGTGADFTNVTAIRFQIDIAAAADSQINFLRVIAPDVFTQDFPNLNPMSIGNNVFNDSNNNGVQDVGEPGIPGVRVELYEDTNLNGSYDNGTDTAIGSAQTTDASGNYVFDNLFPGEYLALIPISQFGAGQPLEGFNSSTGPGPANAFEPAPDPDTNVTNADDNGTLIAGVGVATAAITLASGTEPTNDGDTNADSNLTLDFGFAPEIDLHIEKTVNVATVAAGNQITYTLSVSNAGPGDATNVVVTDNLPDLAPDALTIVSATATGGGVVDTTGPSTGEITVTYPTMAAGAAAQTITIVVLVPATAAASAAETNTATVTGQGIETQINIDKDNTATVDVAITRQAVLTISKTDTPDPSTVGGALTYEILVTNTGPSSATNVVATDTLPSGLTFSSTSTTAGTVAESGGVITANIPTLAVGASATITVVTTIDATFSGSTIPNSASADADEAAPVTASATTVINPEIDLTITKTDSIDPVRRGDQLIYTITASNNGPSGATNVTVTDTLPAGVTFASATGTGVVSHDGTVGSGAPVTVNVGSLASGQSKTITMTVNVRQSAAATISNTATISSSETIAGFERTEANGGQTNTATEPTAIFGEIDLEIAKTGPATGVPGQALSYTITVTNHGPTDATNVLVTDNLPDGIQITTTPTSTLGTVTLPSSAQDTTPANNDDMTVNIPNLASGATATITVNATILPGSRNTLTNTVTVLSTDTSLTEVNDTQHPNTASVVTTLNPDINLQVTKTDGKTTTNAGTPSTYTIVVTNTGPSTATNVTLSDTLPSGVTFTNVTSSQGTVGQSGGIVSGNLGTLAPGGSATVTLLVGVNGNARGTLTNTASATATEDSTPVTGSDNTTVVADFDLGITKTDSVDPVPAGGSLTYTLTVTNNGPSTAQAVVVTDPLPSGVTFVATGSSSSVGTVTSSGNTVTANLGDLASGATATVTINTTVSSTATGTLSNTATVAASESETNNVLPNTATEPTTLAVPGSISGVSYLDSNRNGVFDTGDTLLPNVLVTLTGTDMQNNNISRQATTDGNGAYTFDNLLPGTYQVVQTQPEGLGDGAANPGTGATNNGVAGTNQISTIELGSGQNATAFNFGDVRAELSKRRFLASSVATA